MKSILRFIVSVLLMVGIVGGAYALTKAWQGSSNEEQSESTEQSVSGKTESSGIEQPESSDSGNTTPSETATALTEPSNKSALVQDGITMATGAAVYLGEDEPGPAIRFTFNVSADVKTAVESDEDKTLAFLCAPVEYFDEVNTGNYTYIDWVTAFERANKTVIYSELDSSNFQASGENYIMRFRLQSVLYKNTNRAFVCMLVLATKTGSTTTYRYNGYESGVNYRNNARSLAYVSSAALNAHALGLETFDETALTKLKSYVNRSVDYANGLEEATGDNSTYAYQVKALMHENMQVGEKFTIAVTITPDVDVPVWYRSTDESVATVDDNGVVTITGKGTAVIGVYVAGQVEGVTVTIE